MIINTDANKNKNLITNKYIPIVGISPNSKQNIAYKNSVKINGFAYGTQRPKNQCKLAQEGETQQQIKNRANI